MQFAMLGHLEVLGDGGEPVVVSQPLLRSTICILLLKIDQPLSSLQLQELLLDVDDSIERTGSVRYNEACAQLEHCLPPSPNSTDPTTSKPQDKPCKNAEPCSTTPRRNQRPGTHVGGCGLPALSPAPDLLWHVARRLAA